jgi:transcriptional regulator with XRE-family HTH domain
VSRTLGEVLREARRERGWTLREVERRSGVRNAHLSQIESGVIERPDTGLLWTLAGLYGMQFSALMQLAGRTSPQGQGDDGTAGSRRRSLAGVALQALDDLTPAQQEQALAYMDELRRAAGSGGGRSRRLSAPPARGALSEEP